MKKILLLLLLMNAAAGISVSITSDKYEVGSLGNILVNYSISLNKEELATYSIMLGNVTVANDTTTFQYLSNSTLFNVSSLPAGTYPLILSVKSPSVNLREEAPFNITILKNMNCEINAPSSIYAFYNVTSSEMSVRNSGNTLLSISAYFEGALSDVSVNPQSFLLGKGEERVIKLLVSRPEKDYNATLVVNVNNGELVRRYPVSVINPCLNISMSDFSVKSSANKTFITAVLTNTGNSPANLSISVRTFSILHGFKTINDTVYLNAGEQQNYSFSFPKSSVLKFSFSYFNGTDNVKVERNLSPLGSIAPVSLSKEKLILVGFLLLLALIVYHVKFRRKRP